MAECKSENDNPFQAPGMYLFTGLPAGISRINTAALIPNGSVNVKLSQPVNVLEARTKDLITVQGDTASPGICSVIFAGEPIVYKEAEKGNATSPQQMVNSMFPGISIEDKANSEMQNLNQVTHIEIIREVPHQPVEIMKLKPGLSRRVTGANRVVPLITSLWQKGELKAVEPTLYSTYKSVLDNPDNTEERQCEICHKEFLSSTEVEQHVKHIHSKEYITPQQCFVCTKMYVFEAQLKRHLSLSHGIQYPEMICKICFMEFNTAIEKKAHERKHDKIYSCDFCSSKFASEYSWQKHYTEHLIAKKPYQCSKCGTRFCQQISLLVHKRRHELHLCSLCCSYFNEDLQFLLHLKNHAPGIQKNFLNNIKTLDQEENHLEEMLSAYYRAKSSNLDSWKFKEADQDVSGCVDSMVNAVSDMLEADIQPSELSQKNGVECKLCGLEMSSATDLLDHRRKSHLRSCTCPFCGKRSRSVSQTCRHMITHIGRQNSSKSVTHTSKTNKTDAIETGGAFECQLCNKVFCNKGKKNHHLETVHKMNIVSRPYCCTICVRKFQYKAARDRHMLVHSKEKNDCWKCAVCDHAFLRPKFLLRHIKEHEAENVCHICNRRFPKKTKLKLHLRSHNSLIAGNRLKCVVCPISCPTISALREHIRTHTGERPYSCNQCELKFKRSQALKQHLKSVHNGPGSTSYACSLCTVAFNRKGNLMRHILANHHAVRRFICGACGHRYGQNQDLRRHLRNKHQLQLANIPSTEKKPVNEVYVFPPLEALPASHVQRINLIIAEEKLKIQQLFTLGCDTNIPTHSEHNSPLRSTVQMLSVKPASKPKKRNHLNVTIQSKEFSEPVTNKAPVTFVKDQSFIPLHNLHICTRCNNITFRERGSVTDHENSSISCKQCSNIREELPDMRSESRIVKRGVIIAEQANISLEKLSLSALEGTLNDTLINELLTNGIEESLYENLASLMNQDLGGTSEQVLTQNVMLQPSLAVPLKVLNENLLMTTSDTPSTTSQAADNNSVLVNNCSTPTETTAAAITNTAAITTATITTITTAAAAIMNAAATATTTAAATTTTTTTTTTAKAVTAGLPLTDVSNNRKIGALHLSTSTETPVEADKCLLRNTLEEKGDETPADAANNEASPETSSSVKLLPQMSLTQNTPNDAKKNMIFNCKICNKKFDRKSAWERHMQAHSGVKAFRCETCDKLFGYKHNLKTHSRVHTGERPYECVQCNKPFRYLKDLSEHEKRHQGIKPHVCTECGRKFLRQRDLKRHRDIHSNKGYECPVCNKMFRRLDQMKMVHMKTHEQTRTKPHVCGQCNKHFGTKLALKKHTLLHSAKKIYDCTICGKSFAAKMYLTSHMKTHEKQENYIQCPKCPRKFASESTLQIHSTKFHKGLNRNSEEKQHIMKTSTDTTTEYSAATVINTELDLNHEGKNCGMLEDEACNAVIYLQMFAENEVPLSN